LEELLPKDNENIRLPFVGPVAPSEPQGFTLDQMIRCEECLRANAPTRVNCLYCASALPLTESSAQLRKPTLKRPDKGQPGYNSIFLPQLQSPFPGDTLAEAAELLKLAPEDLERIVSAGRPLPLARTDSQEEASLVVDKLHALGVETITLADDDLGAKDCSVRRIRSMQFNDDGMSVQQGGALEAVRIAWPDLVLLVPGRLLVKRIEVKERRSRKSENEILSTSEFFADESVVDLYTSSHSQTWRISAHSFDFSCLKELKTLVAAENLSTLISLIRSNAQQAKFDDSYKVLRSALEPVWGMEQETESSGWRRERPGKYSFGSATISSNESQFTLYSRLSYHFNINPPNGRQ
jgi:hypothetical protein